MLFVFVLFELFFSFTVCVFFCGRPCCSVFWERCCLSIRLFCFLTVLGNRMRSRLFSFWGREMMLIWMGFGLNSLGMLVLVVFDGFGRII